MTELTKFSGAAQIGNEGIKKHFTSFEHWEPLFELVWNGFDAKAKQVDVVIQEDDLGKVTFALVLDDGEGIDHTKLDDTFGRFFDSAKKSDPGLHGAHGRGRLAFHIVCRNAAWYTRSTKGDAVIRVEAANIKNYGGDVLEPSAQREELRGRQHGTLVELTNFSEMLPALSVLREKFSVEFGWFLAVRGDRQLRVNDVPIEVPQNESVQETLSVDGHVFEAQVIRWESRPTSEKSYVYLLNGRGELVYRALSTLNNKPNFFTSVCLSSAWADTFSAEDSLFAGVNGHTPTSEVWKKLWRQLATLTNAVYESFLRRKAEEVVQAYEENGYFPTYDGLEQSEKVWRLGYVRELVKQIYIADPQVFNTASKKQLKIIIRLLDRLSVSNENEALLDVLNGALDLDDQSVQRLASQLKQTTFENIVSTIEVLQRRAAAVEKLRYVMNVHYREVRETPDLQKIIENNTWLFGPKYEILGAEEDSFTKIARKFRDKVFASAVVDEGDVEDSEDVQGAQRQVDLFMARRVPALDSGGRPIFKCVIVEIKRPAIALNKKHLRQLEDYADIIRQFPEFNAENLYFELILVGRKISDDDLAIKRGLDDLRFKGEPGLISDGDPRMKLFVLNWYTLLNSFDLAQSFLLDKLRLKRAEFEGATKDELIQELQEAH